MSTELEKMNIHRLSNKESNRVTKECICSAMIGLMSKHPYDKISMTMIIERSGASRASVYRNYPSKEDIMLDITKNFTDELSHSLSQVLSHDTDTKAWLTQSFKRLASDRDMCILAQSSNLPFVELFYEAICSAANGKEITWADEYRIKGFAAGLWEIAMAWIKNGMKESPDEMSALCTDLFNV